MNTVHIAVIPHDSRTNCVEITPDLARQIVAAAGMDQRIDASPAPLHQLVGRLESALKARDEAAARVKAELHAVAGTDCSRAALDLYRREYTEANDLFCDLLLMNAADVVAALKVRTVEIVDSVRAVAREHGWAIGTHGSMVRDIDLIGVPWTADATDPETLVGAIMRATGYWSHGHPLGPPRPGGRRSILLFHREATYERTPKGTWTPPALDLSLVCAAPANAKADPSRRRRRLGSGALLATTSTRRRVNAQKAKETKAVV